MCQFKIDFRIICHQEFNLKDYKLITKIVGHVTEYRNGNFKDKKKSREKNLEEKEMIIRMCSKNK